MLNMWLSPDPGLSGLLSLWYNLDVGACEIPQAIAVDSQGCEPPCEGLDINYHNNISDRDKERVRK